MNEGIVLDAEQLLPDDNIISESIASDSPVPVEGTDGTAADLVTEQSVEESSASVTEVTQVIEFPYSSDNPLPVTLIEEEVVEEQTELEVYALTGKYYGTISETYLDYFEGIVEKLLPNEHYVIWRSGQYAYNMCYGENITLEGSFFSGDANLCTIYRSSDSYSNEWYVDFGSDILSLSAENLFVYSDLGMYPKVERGAKHGEEMALLVAICVATVYVLARSIFDFIRKYVYRK